MFTMVAAAAGVVLATAVAILVAGFFGADPSHLPGLPNLQPAQQEVVKVPDPQPTPTPATTAAGRTNSSPAPTPSSTLDTRGNKPTHTPNHPRPTRTK
ncbi:MAG TPA: hypothetical protein VF062_11160 [Candidatus Limnocylindrales bacterium]